jgi:hypothetical protein
MDVPRRRSIDDAVVDLARRQNYMAGFAAQAGPDAGAAGCLIHMLGGDPTFGPIDIASATTVAVSPLNEWPHVPGDTISASFGGGYVSSDAIQPNYNPTTFDHDTTQIFAPTTGLYLADGMVVWRGGSFDGTDLPRTVDFQLRLRLLFRKAGHGGDALDALLPVDEKSNQALDAYNTSPCVLAQRVGCMLTMNAGDGVVMGARHNRGQTLRIGEAHLGLVRLA